jgi:hypothetical protein
MMKPQLTPYDESTKPRSSFSGGGVLTSQRRSQIAYDLRVSAWCGIASARCENIIPQFVAISAGQYLNRISFTVYPCEMPCVVWFYRGQHYDVASLMSRRKLAAARAAISRRAV